MTHALTILESRGSQLQSGMVGFSKVGQIGPQIGKIRDFFKSDFSKLQFGYVKFDVKKSGICDMLG